MESGKFNQREVAEVEAEAIQHIVGFPGGSDSKQSACNVGDLGSIPGLGRSLAGEHGKPLQYRNPYGQRSLVGCNPRGRKELNTTE